MVDFRRVRLFIGFPFLLAASLLAVAPAAAAEGAQKPNIVIVMADDLGFSDIGCYGGEISTPHLDRLAAGGLRFTQFYNAARCCPTRAALLTGLYPHRAGMGGMVGGPERKGPYQGYLNDRCVTIGEVLRTSGYATYLSGKWHVGEFRPVWPIDRGFDESYGLVSGGMNYFNIHKGKHQSVKRVFVHNDARLAPAGDGFYATDAFTDQAVKMLQQHPSEQPFFLYLAYTAPHWPLHAPEEDVQRYLGKYRAGWSALRKQRWEAMQKAGLVGPHWTLTEADSGVSDWEKLSEEEQRTMDRKMAVYAAQVEVMDRGIGRVVEQIERMGQLDNTLILFLSDNGGCGEGGTLGANMRPDLKDKIGTEDSYHNYGRSWANLSNTPFRLYKQYTHEGGIASPLIVHWPAKIAERGALRHQVGHVIDLLPTCLEIAGAEYPQRFDGREIEPVDGISLLPAFEDRPLERETLYWEHQGNRAIREGDWKLTSARGQPWELFNLANNRSEANNLADAHPEKVSELRTKWSTWAEQVGVKQD